MARKTISGISGVLEELISPATASTASATHDPRWPATFPRNTGSAESPESSRGQGCRCARLGRPPGSQRLSSSPKQKITLRVSSNLITDYRDWSWEARCQLSDLVEQALLAYQRLHSVQRFKTEVANEKTDQSATVLSLDAVARSFPSGQEAAPRNMP
jgi:hypothetical protein